MDEFRLLLKGLSLALNKISFGLYNSNYNDNTKILLNANNSNDTDIDPDHNNVIITNTSPNMNINTDIITNVDDSSNNDNRWKKLTIEDTIMIMLLSLNLCEQLFSQFLFKSSPSSSSLSLRQLCVQLSYDIHSMKAYISR